jgi:hypothetical protein
MSSSAYMISHCDDDFLEQAIASVIERVDELVFVDGAYRWVAPLLARSGMDPERSGQKTHDILASFGSKIRYFQGLWDDELHKRSFGYSQCQGDMIIRIDSDEIFDFDDNAYEAFLRSDHGVGEMEFPLLLTPHSQRLQSGLRATPRQCAVFKSSYFHSPLDHCAWLWLVLTPEERERLGAVEQRCLYPEPVIRTAHLTALRTPRTAVNRARFYTLQYFRSTGEFDWTYDQTAVNQPEDKIPQIFNLMSADEYSSYLEGHEIVSGFPPMDGFHIASVRTWSSDVQAQVLAAETLRRQSVDALLDFSRHPRVVVSGTSSMINITTLLKGGATSIEIETAAPLESGGGQLYFLRNTTKAQTDSNITPAFFAVDGTKTVVTFDRVIDTAPVLEAVLIFHPVTRAPLKKTCITGLRVLK